MVSRYLHEIVDGEQRTKHSLLVEKVLGKRLPDGAVIHHVDGNGHNNKHNNLVVCQDQGYHRTLHKRTDAYEACGNANWIKCDLCKKYDDPKNLRLLLHKNATTHTGMHRACDARYAAKMRRKKK